jgi:hypothetical protein
MNSNGGIAMADETAEVKPKNYKKLFQSISLLLMLFVPPLFLYTGAKGSNSALEGVGYVLLIVAMIIPLVLKK